MINPLSDSISRIRVALRRKRQDVTTLNSNLVKDVLLKLLQLGYLSSFSILDFKKLLILLKYMLGDSVISTIENFYRSSTRLYLKLFYLHSAIMRSYISIFSVFFVTTSRGVLTDAESRMLGIGGRLLLAVS